MKIPFLLSLLFAIPLPAQTATPQQSFVRIPEAPMELTVKRADLRAFLLDVMKPMMQAAAPAQTWVTVAKDGDSISIPAGTVTRYGDAAGQPNGCNSSGPKLAADAWVTPTKLGATVSGADLGVADPAFCYVKELDVAETASVQVVQVNGKSVTVPALPVVVVVPPPVPPTTSTSYVLSSDTAKPLVLTINSDGTWTLSGGGKAVKQP